MNHCLEYTQDQYKYLYEMLVNSTQNILQLENIVADLYKAVDIFSKSLQTIGEKFHECISGGFNEGDSIVSSYQHLSNYLLRISTSWNNIAQQLNTEVIQQKKTKSINRFRSPLTNRTMFSDGKQLIKDMEQSREQMLKSQQEYWKLMNSSDKATQAVQRLADNVEKGQKTKDDFQKMFDKSFRLQEVAKESEEDYKKLIDITNKKWISFDEQLSQIYKQANLNDHSRIKFTIQTIQNVINVLTQFNVNDEQLITYYNEKFSEIDNKLKTEQKVDLLNVIEKNLEKKGSNYSIIDHFIVVKKVQVKKEEFISFEQWQNINSGGQMFQMDPNMEGTWVLVGDSITDQERSIVDNYIDKILIQKVNEHEEIIIRLKQLLQKQTARTYFTDKMYRTLNDHYLEYYIQLTDDIYNDLLSIIRHWLNYIDMNDVFDCDEIHKLLQISMRISKKSQKLSAALNDLEIWTKIKKWVVLYHYICSKKMEQKRKKVQMLRYQSSGGILKKGIGFIGKGVKFILGSKQEQQFQVNETEVVYLILEEINLFIIGLQLKPQLSSEIIIQLALDESGLDKDHLVKLLEKQENINNTLMRKEFANHKSIKEEKYLKKYLYKKEEAIIYGIQLSLKFFHLKDKPYLILLTNKQFHKKLQKHIYKFYLLNPKLLYTVEIEPLRRRFIKTLLKIESNPKNYVEMKMKVGIDSNIHSSTIEEIISLDVQRSLHIHQKKISSSILQSLLRTFAYFNEEIGYCQGMNYIAGYLFLTFNDEEITYKVFDSIMADHFKDLFIQNFDQLKVKFYQFDRLLSIFLPELAEHFKQEKIDPSYYAASWFITMFSSVFQYAMRSAFLNIIWDIFLVEQWKGFFRCAFYILYIMQGQMLKMEFDEILHFLGELIRSEIFQIDNEKDLLKHMSGVMNKQLGLELSLKQHIREKFKITNKLLNNLEKEYQCFQLNVGQRLKEYQQKK